MLRIRLSRTGRKNFPSYRIVIAEHSAPIKGKFIEIVGHYIPSRDPKVFEYDADKINAWIAKGAKPTDTVASLLKNAGMSGMEPYIEPKNKQKKKKKEEEPEETPAATPATEDGDDKPAEESAKEETPAKDESAEKPKEEAKENPPADKPEEQTEAPAKEKADA